MNKLYYIANARIPTEKAHGIQVMKMCEAFAGQGMAVELIVPRRRTSVSGDPFVYYGVVENFRLTKLWCLDTVRFGRWGFLVESISFALSSMCYVLFKRGSFYTRDEILVICLKILGKKTVWETHMGHKNLFAHILSGLKISIVAISSGLKEFYMNRGFAGGKILVAPDALDLDQFSVAETREHARKSLGLDSADRVVMYVGLFDEWKGYRTLLEASLLMGENSPTVVMIGGSSQQNMELSNQYPKVRFIGYRSYTELPVNQKAADILVIPNSGKTEISRLFTSPLKLFAHMASGVPILSSDLPSIREVLDESDAYFFEADNSENLAQTIKKVFAEYDKATEKAQKALEKVRNYTWEKRARAIKDFINV